MTLVLGRQLCKELIHSSLCARLPLTACMIQRFPTLECLSESKLPCQMSRKLEVPIDVWLFLRQSPLLNLHCSSPFRWDCFRVFWNLTFSIPVQAFSVLFPKPLTVS
jgi:hypothetical protein